jgi:hypothetical protein
MTNTKRVCPAIDGHHESHAKDRNDMGVPIPAATKEMSTGEICELGMDSDQTA